MPYNPYLPFPKEGIALPLLFLIILKTKNPGPGRDCIFEILSKLLLLLINRVAGVFTAQVDVVGQYLSGFYL